MLTVQKLRCEYRKNPIGLGEIKPRFSWQIVSEQNNTMQSAYRLEFAQDPSFEVLFFDSGKISQDSSIQVAYPGPALSSRLRLNWRVTVWDNHGQTVSSNGADFFEMGLLDDDDWSAKWIAGPVDEDDMTLQPAPVLRKEFNLPKPVTSARLYASAQGIYQMQFNGKKVSEDFFAPGWTSYHHRIQVQAYDVTDILIQGENAWGIALGEGWFKGALTDISRRTWYASSDLAALGQLEITYHDGTTETIVTDEYFTASVGPIRENGLYFGENYDARLEMPGWDQSGFDAPAWTPVRVLQPPKGKLIAQVTDSVRCIEEIVPIALITTPSGQKVLDMGQNMVGFIRFAVRGERGSRVVLHHGEVLDKDGNFYNANLRTAPARIEYILKGEGEEMYHPTFTFMGFRYVWVEEYPGDINPDDFTGMVLHTPMEETGSFACDEPLVNRLVENIRWSQKGNFLDIPTDCPQRDERLGWTADAQVFMRTACYMMDSAAFFTKWLGDLAADQEPNGAVPITVPVVNAGGVAGWGDAAVICPWVLYQCYGDVRILERQFDSMCAWIDFIRSTGEDEYLWNTGFQFADWLALDGNTNHSMSGGTPEDLVATSFYAYSTHLLSKAARIIGREHEAHEYEKLFEKIVEAFRREFVTPAGRMASHTQTGYILPLMFDLLDDNAREINAKRLVDWLAGNSYHLTTGFMGTPYLCPVLSQIGRDDVAYKLLFQEDFPSWLYQVQMGATTIWEHWDSIRADGSFWSTQMNSFNHYAYGTIGQWLYQFVAGIDTFDDAPGYKHSLIAPRPGGPINEACAKLETPYGQIASRWETIDGQINIEVTIPANTKATVVLPQAKTDDIIMPGASSPKVIETGVELVLGSGTYRFTYPFQKPPMP